LLAKNFRSSAKARSRQTLSSGKRGADVFNFCAHPDTKRHTAQRAMTFF
jgi:hypothetical protein